jgi:hypothetical protein
LQAAANCLLTENELKATASVKANWRHYSIQHHLYDTFLNIGF